MTFPGAAELSNHKEKFCVGSIYNEPEKALKSLEASESSFMSTRKDGKVSFEEVKKYLKSRTSATDMRDDRVGPATLAQLRTSFQSNQSEMDTIYNEVVQQRAREKADELRQLKLRQQKLRAERNKEEREVRETMMALEKRKDRELKIRLEKERVKRELRGMDGAHLKSIEQERKQEIAQLAREREALKRKEDDLINEAEKLTKRIKEQEEKFLRQRNTVKEYYNNEAERGKANTKDEKLLVAQHRGERLAAIKAEKAGLQAKRDAIMKRAEKMNVSVGKSKLSATGKIGSVTESDQDELSKIMAEVGGNLESDENRIKRMKAERERELKAAEDELRVMDTELGSFQQNAEFEEDGILKGAESLVQTLERQRREENETRAELGDQTTLKSASAPLDVVADELDKIIAEQDAKVKQVPAAADQRPRPVLQPQASPGGYASPSPGPRGYAPAASSDPVLKEIEDLKRLYYTNPSKNPGLLEKFRNWRPCTVA